MDALVVIDVQQGMFAFPGFQPFDGEGVVARIRGLLDQARANGTPIFFVQHAGEPGEAIAEDAPGFAFRPELQPLPGEPVTVKKNCSAFQGTDFDTALRGAGIDHLIICGMQSEFCVDTTVRSAFERGYGVTLVSDGHTTFNTPTLDAKGVIAHHNHVLGSGFAKVKPADAIFA